MPKSYIDPVKYENVPIAYRIEEFEYSWTKSNLTVIENNFLILMHLKVATICDIYVVFYNLPRAI